MKIFVPLFLFLIFSALLMINADLQKEDFAPQKGNQDYRSGIKIDNASDYMPAANYDFDVKFDPLSKLLEVKEKMVWINNTMFPTDKIYLHLYANAYKNNKTFFASYYSLDEEERTSIEFKAIYLNDTKIELSYHVKNGNQFDSTVAFIQLQNKLAKGDSAVVEMEYQLKVPKSVKRFGYATGRNFSFVSQWFPKAGVFQDGKWICEPYYPWLNFFSDFGNYNFSIEVPTNFVVGATGSLVMEYSSSVSKIFSFKQNGVHDFAFFVTDEILYKKEEYKRKDGTIISINLFVQPEREKYFWRYKDAVKNSLEFFEDNIGDYPYESVTLVDVPKTSASGGMEYPGIFTVSAELFSPHGTMQPEYLAIHEFTHQFFQGLIANNEVYEAWLDEGFTSYVATKIIYKYYGGGFANFKIATHVPVFGLNFLMYREIPIIYTLADLKVPEGLAAANSYYRNLTIGTLADTSYQLPSRLSYAVNSYSKPELVLLSLERYIGYKNMMSLLKEYYNRYKFKHPTALDFIKLTKEREGDKLGWFFREFYYNARVHDYAITGIKKVGQNDYEILAERLREGFFANDIAVYTDKDTLYQKWTENVRYKVFKFHTKNEVLAAEIDPYRKNMLDINFANNSYTVNGKYWASISISLRWFFWIQNALMILGSIG
ncbi:MAG: M1 family metallopeptidase [Melioribacteraceae bacterium]|nr:M1 family metallopeptidase [Melioribacteraceae bacterium]